MPEPRTFVLSAWNWHSRTSERELVDLLSVLRAHDLVAARPGVGGPQPFADLEEWMKWARRRSKARARRGAKLDLIEAWSSIFVHPPIPHAYVVCEFQLRAPDHWMTR